MISDANPDSENDERPLITVARHVVRLARSVRAKDGSAGALLGQLWLQRYSQQLVQTTDWVSWLQQSSQVVGEPALRDVATSGDPRLVVVTAMEAELEAQLSVALVSLAEASTRAPMHEVLHFLRLATEAMPLGELFAGEHGTAWHALYERIIAVANQVCDLVVGVVGSDAPEGITLEDNTATDSSQMILVTGWRSMAQAGLLLAGVYSGIPLAVGPDSLGLAEDAFEAAAERMLALLITSKHRGAVDLLQVAFGAVCNRCWNSRLHRLRTLPTRWMTQLLAQMDDADPNSITRRSAGYAAAIVAIISVDTPPSRDLLKSSLQSLFAKVESGMAVQSITTVAEADNGSARAFLEQQHVSCVHALNVLRYLFRCTAVGSVVGPFVGAGFSSVFAGFCSKVFPVKNSSMMLFSVLLDRGFGTKRARDVAEARQTLTGREFFTRFPALYGFLLDSLRDAADRAHKLGGDTPESLLPMLLLLSHLTASPLDGVDNPYSMSCFEAPLLRLCAWWVFQLASRSSPQSMTELLSPGTARGCFAPSLFLLPDNTC